MNDMLLFDAITDIDERLIDGEEVQSKEPVKRFSVARRWAVVGACAAVFAVVAVALQLSVRVPLPRFTNPVMTASQIGELLQKSALERGAETNNYVEVRVPSIDELKYFCGSVPESSEISYYDCSLAEHDFDYSTLPIRSSGASLRGFANKYLQTLCDALDIPLGEHKEYMTEAESYNVFHINIHEDGADVNIAETPAYDTIYFYRSGDKTTLYGVPITVDQTESDERIAESVEGIRQTLCEIFQVDLPDIKVRRYLFENGGNGCGFLQVYFYNAEKNGVDIEVALRSDYIRLEFDNYPNSDTEVISDDVLSKVVVAFVHTRLEPQYYCNELGKARLISLEEAEQLLYNGYVFSGHHCPLCMARQDKVSFKNYDKVGFTYCKGLPFYVFFKRLDGVSYRGNEVYAKTMVAALEVDGYEEYFESQKKYHPGYASP